MRQIIWTNFAVAELKNIYLYYQLAGSKKTADRNKKEIFLATKTLLKQPLIGPIEVNLLEFNQGHRCIMVGNYKIIYRAMEKCIFNTDVFDCRQDPMKLSRSSK